VKAFNISHQQIAYAREQAKARGLARRVEFIEDDYRNVSGEFDAFVSVGMLEHVGKDNYKTLGDVVHRSLKRGGLGIIHSVGRSRTAPPNAWLEQRIFPGSYPPSLRDMMDIFEAHEFSILDIENLRLHYAQTLMEWLRRFDSHADEIMRMYDESFVRAWRLYLGGCAAAFLASTIQLFQVVFAHPDDNRIPMTRGHVYGTDGSDWDL
jgi:cyclopropane-fatty-acyl-phospholipid synthase